ncbi:MAG: hypothetical protein CMQ41_09825 [Gammaproteobacteria bacterium]|nr:hypothetical protein [Gammaproteobacteria bacterium]
MEKLVILFSIFLTQLSVAQMAILGDPMEPVPTKITGVVDGKPPSDAIVLFDGKNMDAWEHVRTGKAPQWLIEDGILTVKNGTGTLVSKQHFRDIQMHIEWRPSGEVIGEGQSRGNSGIFMQSLFEIQMLDSWENPTYVNGQAGSVYHQYPPLVNAANPPGEWQNYDIIFSAPIYDRDGNLERPAFITLLHNGVLVLNHVEVLGSTFPRVPEYKATCEPYELGVTMDCTGKLPLLLQDHGQVVSFRNIWLREL